MLMKWQDVQIKTLLDSWIVRREMLVQVTNEWHQLVLNILSLYLMIVTANIYLVSYNCDVICSCNQTRMFKKIIKFV